MLISGETQYSKVFVIENKMKQTQDNNTASTKFTTRTLNLLVQNSNKTKIIEKVTKLTHDLAIRNNKINKLNYTKTSTRLCNSVKE